MEKEIYLHRRMVMALYSHKRIKYLWYKWKLKRWQKRLDKEEFYKK